MNTCEIKCIAKDGVAVPSYETSGAAGADVRAFLNEPVVIPVGKRAMIPTGLFFSMRSCKQYLIFLRLHVAGYSPSHCMPLSFIALI